MGKNKNDNEKVVVVGLDGANWKLLKKLAGKGWLPNIKKLLNGGVCANLITTTPPLTGPAWVSFVTGKNPGSHGCYNFMIPHESLLDTEPISTKTIKGRTFYEILEKDGYRSILINLPCSSPPRIKKGIILPSFFASDSKETYPKNLVNIIPEIKKYRVMPDFLRQRIGGGEAMAKDARDLEKVKFSIAKNLFRNHEWNFFFVFFGITDWIQHKRYKHLLSGEDGINSEFIKAYIDLDNYIGWFLDNISKETTFILMSDHGFKSVSTYFHINKWLKEKGFLNVKIPKLRSSASLPFTPMRIIGGNAKGLSQNFVKYLSSFLISHSFLYLFSGHSARFLSKLFPITKKIIPSELLNVGYEIDPQNSVAYSISGGNVTGIYINDKARFKDGIVSVQDYEKIREKIILSMKNLRDKNGKKVFKYVYKKENVYSGDYLLMAPDILYQENEHIIMTTILSGDSSIEKSNDGGWHDRKGIFAAYGENILKGKTIKDISYLDFAPTILHLFGKNIPIEMEGRILFEIFKK